MDDFKNEGIVASTSWPLQVILLQGEKDSKIKINSVVPEEGVTGWADTTMMAANAPHQLRLSVARAFAEAEDPGRRRGLVRQRAVGAGSLQRPGAARRRRAAPRMASTSSRRSTSGRRR